MSDYDVTYRLLLDHLDQDAAMFDGGNSGTSMVLPRERWEQLGRPSSVNITPVAS